MGSGIINEQVALAPVAQAESTRSYFLAQTLESTRTVPVVSAKLPVADGATDEVLGSFTYRGITYAVEPGGESVAIVAADRSKLPQDFLEAQTIVLPSVVSSDGIDFYSVSRIANGAFSSLTKVAASASEVSQEADAPSDDPTSDALDGDDTSFGASDGDDLASDAADDDASSGTVDEGSPFDPDIEDAPSTGITAITIPASVTSIEDDAFAGFDTLQYVIVSDDNPNYSMYDGCLYDEPLESLLLIPGGRLGAVRVAPSATSIPEKAYSHCAHLEALVADPASAASQLLEGDGSRYTKANGEMISVFIAESEGDISDSLRSAIETSEALLINYPEKADADNTDLASSASRTEDEEIVRSESAAVDPVATVRTAANAAAERDSGAAHEIAFTNGYVQLALRDGLPWWFLTGSGAADGVISWTGGTSQAPSPGSVVTVRVTRYENGNPECVREVLVACAIELWGGDEKNEIIGMRNTDTGSYTSVDSIFSGGEFSFSFVMPESGCSISASGFSWVDGKSSFVPVFAQRDNAIYNYFRLTSGSNSMAIPGYGWTNSATGVFCQNTYAAAVYSDVGGPLGTPTHSIPTRAGHTFLGWYTDPDGGELISDTALAEDCGRTYYAHWGVEGGSLSFTNGYVNLTLRDGLPWWFLTGNTGADGTISWTGGTSQAPSPGSVVTVRVTRYESENPECVREVLVACAIDLWGGDEQHELIGMRNTDTGSYTSVDSIFSGGEFSFSFIMPQSGCSVSASGFRWIDGKSSFVPVFLERGSAIYNYFRLTGGDNGMATSEYGWTNSNTGVFCRNTYAAAVYSDVGGPLSTPTHSIPTRVGHTFLGWYTDPDGGELIPDTALAEDCGRTYYAHWGVEGGSLSFTNGQIFIQMPDSVYCFLSGSIGTDGVVSWTGGTLQSPTPGSVVTVRITRYESNNPECVREVLTACAIEAWGGSERNELIGMRNIETGSYTSIDSIFSGGEFTFSFVMPGQGCQISASGVSWSQGIPGYSGTTFVPVFAERNDTIFNYYRLTSGTNGTANIGYGWTNPNTGVSCYNTYAAAVYSTIGETVQTPTHSIPTRPGYTFLGWYTEPEGGDLIPDVARAEDNGRTYYAHWGNKDSQFYYLKLNENAEGSNQVVSRTNPVEYGFSFGDSAFRRTGRSILSYNTAADGSGTVYALNQNHPAPSAGTTITVYAQWGLDRYTLAYDLAGGSWEGEAGPDHYDHADGTVVSVPDPVRKGYDFCGWTGTGLDEATMSLAIDAGSNDKLGEHEAGTSVYARSYVATWTPHAYQISFDLSFDDGSASWKDGEAPAAGAYDAIAYDSPVTFPKAPVRAGWIFTGWAPVEADATKGSYAAEETVDPGNFASDQGAVASFEAHWVRNLEVSVPLGSKDVGLSVSADLVEGTEFDVVKGTSEIVNLSDGELKVVSVREDTTDADALSIRKANALEAFGGTSSNASKVEAVSFVLRPTSDGTTPDTSKEEARFPLFGSHAFSTDTWRIPASSGVADGTDAPSLRILYDLTFDYSKIAITDLKLNLDAKPISSLVFTVELVDPTEPSYSVSA